MPIMRASPLTGPRPAASVALEVAAKGVDGLDLSPLKARWKAEHGDAHAMKIATSIVDIFRSDRRSNERVLAIFSSDRRRKVIGDCRRSDDWKICVWLICWLLVLIVATPHL